MEISTIAQRIREAREAAEMNQLQLAERMGMHKSLICKWEAGLHRPTIEAAQKLAAILGAPVADFLTAGDIETLRKHAALVQEIDEVEYA